VLALREYAPILGGPVKERLTGAIILVALIVCLVPELLKGPVRSAPQPVDASAEAASLKSITFDVGAEEAHGNGAPVVASGPPAPTPLTAEPAATPTPAAAPPAATPEPTAPASTPPAPETHAAGTTPAPAARARPPAHPPAHATPSSTHGWLVQVGSFAQRGNAEHLAQQLSGQGFAASVSQSPRGRHLYRVWVGPVHDKAGATQLAVKLRAAGHKGSVVSQ
jgi:DedD protein